MNKKTVFSLLILISLFLVACSGKKDLEEGLLAKDYKIYYLNNQKTKIVEESHNLKSVSMMGQVEELFKALEDEPKNASYKKALPDYLAIIGYEFNGKDRLVLNFESSYNKLTGIEEVLCRATIVKTLGQIEGFDYIEFTVNGQPLVDSNDGLVGLMTRDSFIESISAETEFEISLYFSNESGDSLVRDNSKVLYTGSSSLEKLIIIQLINGPNSQEVYPTLPQGTVLLDVTTKNGICYVDFNDRFMDKIPEIDEDVAIYSVVNSLVEIPTINKVQFLIDGQERKVYRKNKNFDKLFERNLSIIKEEK